MDIIKKVNEAMQYKTIIKKRKMKSKNYYIMQVITLYNNEVVKMQSKKIKI